MRHASTARGSQHLRHIAGTSAWNQPILYTLITCRTLVALARKLLQRQKQSVVCEWIFRDTAYWERGRPRSQYNVEQLHGSSNGPFV
jgi:hypothetical protein